LLKKPRQVQVKPQQKVDMSTERDTPGTLEGVTRRTSRKGEERNLPSKPKLSLKV